MSKKTEKILVVPREYSIKEYLNKKCQKFSERDLEKALKDAVYGTRYLMEENKKFKQIIPYIAFIDKNNNVLVYKRSLKSGEDRLHEKYSLGIGGHIDLGDPNMKHIEEVYNSAIREVKEEIGVDINKRDLNVVFCINDDSNEVGEVHFGIGFIIRKEIPLDLGEKDILIERKFMSKEEIEKKIDQFETWSQIFYENLIKEIITS